jgi:hypothetical protein
VTANTSATIAKVIALDARLSRYVAQARYNPAGAPPPIRTAMSVDPESRWRKYDSDKAAKAVAAKMARVSEPVR